jgi:2-methylcitrate dehydratase PrpD
MGRKNLGGIRSQSLTERIADFTLSLQLDSVPKEVVEHGKLLLTDTFGVAMACAKMEHAVAIRRALLNFGSGQQCTLWGSMDKVQLADAILYNAGLIHGADYDDTHVGGIVHPSAAVVSTAVTVGEYVKASGKEILEAIIAGWEIITRLALAAKGRFHDLGYHGTGIVAPFASACVAVKLLKLSGETLVNAMGICGSQAAALQEFLRDGTWVKKLHPGWAGHSAIYALMMAKEGFTGPQKVLEGDFGMWKTHLGTLDGLEDEFSNLGIVWHTLEITFKMYPVCHMTHSFIDCMLALQREYGFTADDLASVECRIEPRCYHIVCEPRETKIRPQTDYMMRFSLPYVLAVAATHKRMSPWEIDMKYARNPKIQALMDKITCIADSSKSNPGYFPGWLQVTLKNGNVYTKSQLYELGAPQNPITKEAVVAKFDHNLSLFYTKRQRTQIYEQIEKFETLTGVRELIESLLIKDSKSKF